MGTMTESERLDSLESRVIKLESRMIAPEQMPPRPQQKTDLCTTWVEYSDALRALKEKK